MGIVKTEEMRDIAVKLGVIYAKSPTDFAYLKGWIHCLLLKEEGQYSRKGELNAKKKG